ELGAGTRRGNAVSLLLVELEPGANRRICLDCLPTQTKDLAQVEKRVSTILKEVRLRYKLDGAPRHRFRVLVSTAPREDLRLNPSPFDLGREILGDGGIPACPAEPLRLFEPVLRVERLRQHRRGRREQRLLAHFVEAVVRPSEPFFRRRRSAREHL